MSVFTRDKRGGVDLASLAIADRDDVRAADVSEVTTLTAWETARAARVECQRDQERTDEGATSPPRHRDPLRAQEAADREPELLREERRLEREHQRAVRHGEAIKTAARAECRAARVAGLKERIRALYDALADVVPVNDALAGYEAETAALLGSPELVDTFAWNTEFAGDAFRESVLEFRRRKAVEAGLL